MYVHAYRQICCGSLFSKLKYILFAIESTQFCPGYATVYLSWNTYIYNYNIDGKRHREAHKIPNYSPELSSWEIIRNCKLHHLCMIWPVTSLPNLIEFILFSASPRDDNEFPIKLQCKLWPWLVVIFNFWSSPRLLLGPSWSHGSWIHNYLCNQCLSPLTFESRSGIMW